MNTLEFPQKNKKRALRRKEKHRKVEEAQMIANKIFKDHPDWAENWAKRHADNMKSCSCWACGNPRKMFLDDTLQEKKFKESIRCSEN